MGEKAPTPQIQRAIDANRDSRPEDWARINTVDKRALGEIKLKLAFAISDQQKKGGILEIAPQQIDSWMNSHPRQPAVFRIQDPKVGQLGKKEFYAIVVGNSPDAIGVPDPAKTTVLILETQKVPLSPFLGIEVEEMYPATREVAAQYLNRQDQPLAITFGAFHKDRTAERRTTGITWGDEVSLNKDTGIEMVRNLITSLDHSAKAVKPTSVPRVGLIKKVFGDQSKVNRELVHTATEWVRNTRASGLTDQQIEEQLSRAGHNPHFIAQVWKSVDLSRPLSTETEPASELERELDRAINFADTHLLYTGQPAANSPLAKYGRLMQQHFGHMKPEMRALRDVILAYGNKSLTRTELRKIFRSISPHQHSGARTVFSEFKFDPKTGSQIFGRGNSLSAHIARRAEIPETSFAVPPSDTNPRSHFFEATKLSELFAIRTMKKAQELAKAPNGINRQTQTELLADILSIIYYMENPSVNYLLTSTQPSIDMPPYRPTS
ncbi:hypothetical protein JW962_00315 [Candidatus Dojkabacteria bacterium]|nr:hypothetical protein [Candidatus Dojkabacteria bacterium]